MTRGISEEEARAMLVRGFVEPISKELPLEYAVEMNNLINLELRRFYRLRRNYERITI